MEFIIILIALAVEQYYKNTENYRHFGWFTTYCDWMQQKTDSFASQFPSASGPISLLILLVPLLLVVSFVESAFANLGSIFGFLFGIVVLIYSLGPRDMNAQVDKYIESVSAGDTEGALLHANEFFSGHHYDSEIEGSPATIAGLMKGGILLAFNNRILAVLFWFLILGPVGALLYRLNTLLLERFAGGYFGHAVEDEGDSESDFQGAIQRLYMILGWIPARLCVIAFALAGSFSDTLLCWRCASDFINNNNDELIVSSGLHALKMELDTSDSNSEPSSELVIDEAELQSTTVNEVGQIVALVKWSVVIVVTIIALMTIVGWIY